MRCLEISHRRPGARAAQPPAVNLPEFSALVWIREGRDRPRGRRGGGWRDGAPRRPPAPAGRGPLNSGRHSPLKWTWGEGGWEDAFWETEHLGCVSSELRQIPKGDRKKRSENQEPRGLPSVRRDRDLTVLPTCEPSSSQVPKRWWSPEGAGAPPTTPAPRV